MDKKDRGALWLCGLIFYGCLRAGDEGVLAFRTEE
jgi:hypothetical protein